MRKGKNYLIFGLFFVMLVAVCTLSYYIFQTDELQPSMNELTMSYISFQNKNTTDMFKVTNLFKMSQKKGDSSKNPCSFFLPLSGEKQSKYQIVLYPLTNDIPNSYIWYSLESEKIHQMNSLDQLSSLGDGGIILYQGKLEKENKFTYRMWIDQEYSKKVGNVSFEIKIKKEHS